MSVSLQEVMSKFAGKKRPLKTLSKEQLFIYPQADLSTEAGFKYVREVIHRREVFEGTRKAVEVAKERLEEAHMKMVKNADTNKSAYEKQVELRKRDLAKAQAALDALPSNEDAMGHAEITAHYREKHWLEYEALIAKWKAGDLFKAQQFGWTAFLTADLETRRADKEAYKNFEMLASLCGEDKGKDFLEILAMSYHRITPSGRMRRRFLDEDGQLRSPSSMDKDVQKVYWDTWRIYNTATFTHKWTDDSGCAYDDRVFKMQTQEED